VHIGNGTTLPIANKYSALLPTILHSLTLINILHVPVITKNLLSVSQLTLDNAVTVEFSPQFCFIKDKATQQILLHGILHNGLYQLLPHTHHQVFLASPTSSELCHFRLGHCSSSVQDNLQKADLIPIKPSSTASFCSDCH
jgi:hypothetical protein